MSTTADFYAPAELVDILFEGRIICNSVVDCLTGVNNRAVVSSPKMQTYRFERGIGKFLGKVHSNLTRVDNFLLSGLGA